MFVGIDAGSRTIKVVLLEPDGLNLLASGLADQGANPDLLTCQLLNRLLVEKDLTKRKFRGVVATGYSRNAIQNADQTITEITCHAKGVRFLLPEARTIIDIGGQDSKILRLEKDGLVRDFSMNDRCAAGSGRFLEVLANRFGMNLDAFGRLAADGIKPLPINSTCVVFAETEITGLLAGGAQPAEIAAGIQASIASRIATLIGGRITPPVVFTGGVALLPSMARALQEALGQPIAIAPNPQFTGALGAALLAPKA